MTSLNLSENAISDIGVKILAKTLAGSNCKIAELNLSNTNISDVGVKELAEAITAPNCRLTTLRLNVNEISDTGAKTIAKMLQGLDCKITAIELTHNKISNMLLNIIDNLCYWNSKIQAFYFGKQLQNTKFMNICRMDPVNIVVDYLSGDLYETTAMSHVKDGLQTKKKPVKPILFSKNIDNRIEHEKEKNKEAMKKGRAQLQKFLGLYRQVYRQGA